MTFIGELKTHRVRAIKTFSMYTVFISYGLTSGIVGPGMLDFGIMTNSTIAEVSYILPGRSAGGILGAAIGKLPSQLSSKSF